MMRYPDTLARSSVGALFANHDARPAGPLATVDEAVRLEREAPAQFAALASHDGPVADDALSRVLGWKLLVDARTGSGSYVTRGGRTFSRGAVLVVGALVALVLLGGRR